MEIEGSTLTPEEMGYFHKTIGPDEVLIADDTYPAEPLGLKVYGNTRQNLWVNPSGTSNGITVTDNDDGSLTISGESTGTSAVVKGKIYALAPGKTYTVSIDGALSEAATGSVLVVQRDSSGGYAGSTVYFGYAGILTSTFTTDDSLSYVEFQVYCDANRGAQLNKGTYHIMLNEGDTAEPWCPPGLNSVEDVTVWQSGKNLLARMGPELPYTTAGITFSDNGDSGIRISGTATAAAYYNFFITSEQQAPFIPAGTYTAKLTGKVSGTGLTVQTFDHGVGGTYTSWISDGSSAPTTGTLESSKYLRCYLFVSSGTTVDTVVYPQLELGSTATEYEPPNVNTVPIDLQGNELCSLPDGTRDALECVTGEVVKDTQKVVLDGTEDWKLYTNANLRRFGLQKIGLKRDSIYLCDKFPVINPSTSSQVALDLYFFTQEDYYVIVDKNSVFNSVDDFKSFLSSGNMTIIGKAYEKQTFQAAPPELPALPAPNLTAYADSDVPCDMELEYVYDPYYGYSDLLHGMSWLRVDYTGDESSENYSSRVDLGGNRLFALSDELKDELDVISGAIRKRTMYGVLVGTESWSEKTDSTGSQHEAYYQMDIAGGSFSPESDEQGGLFGRLQTKDPKSNDGPCAYCFADSTGIHIRMRPLASAVTGLDGFKDWLPQNHIPYVRYLFEGEEDLSITPVNLPELYDPDVTVGISFG